MKRNGEANMATGTRVRRRPSATEILAAEDGTVRRSWGGRFPIGLVYPNSYYTALSNLGFQNAYALFNECEEIVCERFFYTTRTAAEKTVSIESAESPNRFRILAFSISFENDFINFVSFLDQASLARRREDRSRHDPLIVVGGAAVSINPEAIADFVDIAVLGDAEVTIPLLNQTAVEVFRSGWDKEAFMEATRLVPGIYQPQGYAFSFDQAGYILETEHAEGFPDRIKPAVVRSLDTWPVHSRLMTPYTEFANHFLIEISRGCSQHCLFCYGGWGHSPLRIRSLDAILESVARGFEKSRQLSIKPLFGLIAPSMTDCPDINRVVDYIAERGGKVSFSSLPLAFLQNSRHLHTLLDTAIQSLTLAPEAATETLRKRIGKKWDQDFFFESLPMLWQHNILKIRLYFMIGLPFETHQDIMAIPAFIKKINHIKRQNAIKSPVAIHLSINSFIPKPRTPFQWMPMASLTTIKQALATIRRELHHEKNVTISHDVPKWSRIQALIARADRRVASFLEALVDRQNDVRRAEQTVNLTEAFYCERERRPDEVFPWDHLTGPREKDILLRNYRASIGPSSRS